MWPYSYHPDAYTENKEELESLAIDAVLALEVINSLSAYSTKSTWMHKGGFENFVCGLQVDMHQPKVEIVLFWRVKNAINRKL